MTPRMLLKEIVRVELKQLARQVIRESNFRSPIQHKKPVETLYQEPKRAYTFRGDSRSKKSARLRVWELIQKTIGTKAFLRGPHLFLASHEGGDASTLRGLGVPDKSMIAVDIDAEALSQFLKHYPHVPARNQDVAYVLGDVTNLESVFLDFSSQVSDQTLNKVRFALRAVKPNGVVACTFAIGREKQWNGSKSGSCKARLRVVEEFLQKELSYKPRVLARIRYMSDSIFGSGSLMCVIVVQLRAGRDAKDSKLHRLGFHDLQRDAQRHLNNPNLRWLLNYSQDKTEALRARIKEYPPPQPQSAHV